jgi:hypothetical protein
VPVRVNGTVDTSKSGTYILTYTATDAAGNTVTKTRTVHINTVPDMTPPVITLNGTDTIDMVLGGTFTDPGAIAHDNVDGKVPVSVNGTVDTSKAGTYTLTYSATDAAGNQAIKTRMVNVTTAPDTTPPVITLNGADPMNVDQGRTFTDPGATAMDDVDGIVNITVNGTVDTSKAGTYTLIYSATDAAGNTVTKTRTVHINTVPDMTLPTSPEWINIVDDGKTITYIVVESNSIIELDSSMKDDLEVKIRNDGIIFKEKSASVIGNCQVSTYIFMKSNGDVLAGYIHEGNGCSNDIDEFTPGTKVKVGNDRTLLINVPLTNDLILGGK